MTTRKESKMTKRKVLEYGGMLAGVVLIAFGIGALYLSLDARSHRQAMNSRARTSSARPT